MVGKSWRTSYLNHLARLVTGEESSVFEMARHQARGAGHMQTTVHGWSRPRGQLASYHFLYNREPLCILPSGSRSRMRRQKASWPPRAAKPCTDNSPSRRRELRAAAAIVRQSVPQRVAVAAWPFVKRPAIQHLVGGLNRKPRLDHLGQKLEPRDYLFVGKVGVKVRFSCAARRTPRGGELLLAASAMGDRLRGERRAVRNIRNSPRLRARGRFWKNGSPKKGGHKGAYRLFATPATMSYNARDITTDLTERGRHGNSAGIRA